MAKILFFLAATAATAAAGSSASSKHHDKHKSSKEAAAAGSAPSEDFIKGVAAVDGPAGAAATARAFHFDEFTPGAGAAASKHAGQQAPLPWAPFEGPFRSFLEGGSLPGMPGAAGSGLGKAPTELATAPADGEPEQVKLQQFLAPFGATSMKAGTEVPFSGADLARDLAKSNAGAAWAASDLSKVRFAPQHLPALAGAHETLTDLQRSMEPFQFVAAKGGEASTAAKATVDAKATVRQARAAVESALGKYGIRFAPLAKKPSTVELAADAPAAKDVAAAKKDAWTVDFSNWMDGLKAVMKNVHKQMEERAQSHKGGESAEQKREQAKEQKDEQAKEAKEQKDEQAKEQKEQKDEQAKEQKELKDEQAKEAEQKGDQTKEAAEGEKEAKKMAEEKGADDEKAAPAKKAEEKKGAAAVKDASGEADDKKGAKPGANREAHVSAVRAFLAAREIPASATAAAPAGGLAALAGLAVVAAVRRRRRQQSAAAEPLLYASLD